MENNKKPVDVVLKTNTERKTLVFVFDEHNNLIQILINDNNSKN